MELVIIVVEGEVMSHALSIKGLSKTYQNGLTALRNVSLDVEAGDFFALLGPNGAGKSTIIGIISSLVNKTEGSVSLFGYDIDKQPLLARQQLGLVPQEFNLNLFEKTEDILITQAGYYGISMKKARDRAVYFMEKLGLWEKRHAQARMLSGGMKRRLMVARALVHKPKLLILDEPTAGVDIELRRSLWKFIKEINEGGTTVILTTHYLEEAEQLCRSIAILNQGRIVEHTQMRNLLERLQTQYLLLTLAAPANMLPEIRGVNLKQKDGLTLEAEIEQTQDLNALFKSLSESGIQVLSMRNRENRLETLFLNLTSS